MTAPSASGAPARPPPGAEVRAKRQAGGCAPREKKLHRTGAPRILTTNEPSRLSFREGAAMVIGHHLIWTAYGWWLPNDPRGSSSHEIRVERVADLGELHQGRKRVQPPSAEI